MEDKSWVEGNKATGRLRHVRGTGNTHQAATGFHCFDRIHRLTAGAPLRQATHVRPP